MDTESRWGKRYRTSLNVKYGLNEISYTGVVHDISMFGFFIMTSKVLPDGSVLKIQILTPERDYIHLEGIVQWSVKKRDDVKWLIKDNGMGIKIKRFQSGQEHYEKICQVLCQRKAINSHNNKGAKANNKKSGFFGRFFN